MHYRATENPRSTQARLGTDARTQLERHANTNRHCRFLLQMTTTYRSRIDQFLGINTQRLRNAEQIGERRLNLIVDVHVDRIISYTRFLSQPILTFTLLLQYLFNSVQRFYRDHIQYLCTTIPYCPTDTGPQGARNTLRINKLLGINA